ncbi:tRNA lysidine(34) synthetase TilS [Salinivibrio sp. ES.052]|uniref:tRNA lysidine(34) synthetase TilS n=1 Tax=Salinivibrio sp. ES.052 TaxID=1882823 RepID=UPI00092748D9|nr:tRNA lysidine(34) synthetase TilS [Salinivibrio sp. ES.052]SIO00568.1 tRNA(Ile)-lysidine synthase [Salinivibrio sp. ES.052]
MLYHQLCDCLAPLTTTPRQIILALSGGLDSRVLLDLLAQYCDQHPQHRYRVVHVHHGLQAQADQWAAQCQHWAEQAGFDYRVEYVELDDALSIEHAAREARYQALQQHLEPEGLVLTAQHSDDQIETFFLALKRGSGLDGLAGMPEVRPLGQGLLVRPLLAQSRASLASYASSHRLNWIDDPSNQQTRFDRNFLRQHWLPQAGARWPGFRQAVQRTQRLCAEQSSLLTRFIAPIVENALSDSGALSIAVLPQEDPALTHALLRYWLKRHELVLTYAQLQALIRDVVYAKQDANPCLTIADVSIRRYQQQLYVVTPCADLSQWQGELAPGQPLTLPDGLGQLHLLPYEAIASGLALGRLTSSRLNVHFEPSGLSMHPVGRQGRRKLKKLYQEAGIPSWLRRRQPIICDDQGVIAVADHFVSQSASGQQWRLVWQCSPIQTTE